MRHELNFAYFQIQQTTYCKICDIKKGLKYTTYLFHLYLSIEMYNKLNFVN